ncbi:kinase-like protein [Viridothelium virens]|uniref:Kinase-like protein n=1 Tax=Viridothelium virens TaxID=1048519 RepID=A0A6A6H2B6_VIRVR|nr:kinase-like protein [Viridothelium virens]
MLETIATDFLSLGTTQRQAQPFIESVSISCRPSRQVDLSEPVSASIRGRVARVDSIRSVLDFLGFLSAIPEKFLLDLSSIQEILRRLTSGTKIHSSFIGNGLSFIVRTYTQPDLPAELEERLRSYDRQREIGPAIIAIKSPRIESSSRAFDENLQATALRAVAWECHVLTHPPIQASENIVRLLGIIWEDLEFGSAVRRMVPALAMEYADAGTLDDLIDSQEYSLTYKIKKKLVLDVARGLNDLHQSHFIHGDIKTDNVLLFTDAQRELCAKVADFGCSIHISRENKIVHLSGRSPPWDAPESQEDISSQLLGQIDIYGWGLLVWRVMLDGRTPFDSGKRQSARGVAVFDRILSYDRHSDEFFLKTQELKLSTDDLFLKYVKLTIPHDGIDSRRVTETLSCALLRDPLKRVRSFETISQVLEMGEKVICSSSTLDLDALSSERPSEGIPAKNPIAQPAVFSLVSEVGTRRFNHKP